MSFGSFPRMQINVSYINSLVLHHHPLLLLFRFLLHSFTSFYLQFWLFVFNIYFLIQFTFFPIFRGKRGMAVVNINPTLCLFHGSDIVLNFFHRFSSIEAFYMFKYIFFLFTFFFYSYYYYLILFGNIEGIFKILFMYTVRQYF